RPRARVIAAASSAGTRRWPRARGEAQARRRLEQVHSPANFVPAVVPVAPTVRDMASSGDPAPIITTSPRGSLRFRIHSRAQLPIAHEASSSRRHPLLLGVTAAALSAWPAPAWRWSAIFLAATSSPACHFPNPGTKERSPG
uniref:Uncharacterized protein n=1 Tax=Triticum urartu TaxID=4572 RepID=A0A8R7Q581_TRIUA